MVWAGNLAALELHTPMALAADLESPTMVVFDLDPGDGTAMTECADVAIDIRDTLAGLGLELFPKTSGSKGLQLYLPLNTPHTHDHASEFALAVAQMLEKHHPGKVVSNMKKELRRGKVLIDWSQNSRHKTTVCAYSLRARPHPTVSTPVTWDEVEDAADGAPLSFETADVLDRVDELGDLFAADGHPRAGAAPARRRSDLTVSNSRRGDPVHSEAARAVVQLRPRYGQIWTSARCGTSWMGSFLGSGTGAAVRGCRVEPGGRHLDGPARRDRSGSRPPSRSRCCATPDRPAPGPVGGAGGRSRGC